jgi:hypothetical protein
VLSIPTGSSASESDRLTVISGKGSGYSWASVTCSSTTSPGNAR